AGSNASARSSWRPGEPTPPLPIEDPPRLFVRTGDRRTIDRDDVVAATTMRLFGGIREQALTEARETPRTTSAG
ncbi:hypothetical protein NGM37_30270, partial [Streptomyces sp. TRM76130]|nr:hypothetical protein [Streptomyces sp. TRM76130]